MNPIAMPPDFTAHTVAIDGFRVYYLAGGIGDPIVFLHGNPTSSYLWRNVLPYLTGSGRCIAVDYLGMGRSDKPPKALRLVEHLASLEALLAALDLTDLTLVAHDWGVVLGLALCRRLPERIKGIALLEGHIHPIARWDDFDAGGRTLFRQLRTAGVGEALVLDDNIFIETILPAGTVRTLTAAELDAYRAPFEDKQDRWPMLQWAREIPIAGEPADVQAIVTANQTFLATSGLPKLLLYGEPGAVIGAAEVAWCAEHGRNLTLVNVGAGLHFLPEDQPERIGGAIADWLRSR